MVVTNRQIGKYVTDEGPDLVATVGRQQYRLCKSIIIEPGGPRPICYFIEIGEDSANQDELPGIGHIGCENPRSEQLSPQLIGRALAALATRADFTQEQIEEYLDLLAAHMNTVDRDRFFHQFYTAFHD